MPIRNKEVNHKFPVESEKVEKREKLGCVKICQSPKFVTVVNKSTHKPVLKRINIKQFCRKWGAKLKKLRRRATQEILGVIF